MTSPQTRLRQINEQVIRLQEERGRIIRALHADGYSLREIALIAMVSHQTVANIIAR